VMSTPARSRRVRAAAVIRNTSPLPPSVAARQRRSSTAHGSPPAKPVRRGRWCVISLRALVANR
jgi:hypothetical protein